jgi:hypothetical protein
MPLEALVETFLDAAFSAATLPIGDVGIDDLALHYAERAIEKRQAALPLDESESVDAVADACDGRETEI